MIWITVWYALHFRFLRTHQDVEGLNRLFERLPDYSEIVAIGIVYGLHLLIYRNDSIWDAVSTRHLRMSVEKQRAFRVLSLLLIVSVVLWFIVELRVYWNAGRDWYAV